MASSSELTGLRVLVVEDEAAISLLLEDMLLDFGCEVIGPAARLAAALDTLSREKVDLAILDVNVAGEPIYPVAEALAQRSIPFVFSTGYGSAGIRDAYRDRPVLQKPFAQNDLKQKLLTGKEKPCLASVRFVASFTMCGKTPRLESGILFEVTITLSNLRRLKDML